MAFSEVRRGSLLYLRADSLSGAVHGFTTRLGGVSEGALASLNLGLGRGDRIENVRKNYALLGEAIGFDPESLVLTAQVHSDIVRPVTRENCGEGLLRKLPCDCDGLITNEPGVALMAFSADCATILLHDPVRGAVGAIHSGWRGTAQGIGKKAVEAMTKNYGTDPADVRAAIGPCIGKCCFETDRDVPDAMRAALGADAEPAIAQTGEKYHVDLKLLCRIWLEKAGVPGGQIDVCPDCTSCNPEQYWSYRRMGERRGSLGCVIMLKGAAR